MHITLYLLGIAALGGAIQPPAPAVKAPPARKQTIVLGTTQLPGDFGIFGTTYTMGKDKPLNITLERAEYQVAGLALDRTVVVPRADQKLLVLHYTIHNPMPMEQNYTWWDFRFTAVDGQDRNQVGLQWVGREGTTEPLSIALKPAQKVAVYTAILVPAAGVVPKLLIEREAGAPILRFDLRGKVTPLPAEAAEPGDPQGATARTEVLVPAGSGAVLGAFDARVEPAAYTSEPRLARKPGPGKRFLETSVTLRNRSAIEQRYGWTDFVAETRDADGEKTLALQMMLKGARDEAASGTLKPGEEVRVRFVFLLPEAAEARTLRLAEGKFVHRTVARSYLFPLAR